MEKKKDLELKEFKKVSRAWLERIIEIINHAIPEVQLKVFGNNTGTHIGIHENGESVLELCDVYIRHIYGILNGRDGIRIEIQLYTLRNMKYPNNKTRYKNNIIGDVFNILNVIKMDFEEIYGNLTEFQEFEDRGEFINKSKLALREHNKRLKEVDINTWNLFKI